jgi:hypothetical protein
MRKDNWIQQADEALKRAATRARELAARTNTPLHYIKDGKLVREMPARVPPPTQSKPLPP